MRFAKYENQALLYTAGRGWLAWDGKRWVPESHSAAMIAARRTVWRIAEEADLTTDEEIKKTFKKHQKFSSNVARIEAMIKMASADMQVKMEQLDTNDWLFNCQNGTIDLHTGELLPFNRLNGITNIYNVPGIPITDLGRLAQIRPGSTLRFTPVSRVMAAHLHREFTNRLADLDRQAREARGVFVRRRGSIGELIGAMAG